MMRIPNQHKLAISVGRESNRQGRTYKNGALYGMDQRCEVANTYQTLARQCSSGRYKLIHLAEAKKDISYYYWHCQPASQPANQQKPAHGFYDII